MDPFTEARPSALAWARERLRDARASDFVRNVTGTFLTRIGLLGLGMILGVIVTRILGPEKRGVFAVATTLAALGVQFGNLGLHASNTYLVAGNLSLLPKLVGNSLLVSFGLGGVAAVIGWFTLRAWPGGPPLEGVVLALVLISIPLGLAHLLLRNLLLGIQAVREYNRIDIGSGLLNIVLLGLILWLGIVAVEVVLLSGMLVMAVAAAWAGTRLKARFSASLALAPTLLRDNLAYGFKAWLGALFAWMVVRVDIMMVAAFLGEAPTGYYGVAVSVADLLYMLPTAIGMILFPKLSSFEEIGRKWRFARNTALCMAVIMAPVCAVAAWAAHWAIGLLYGAEFLPSADAFFWLAPAIYLLSINTVFMVFFASMGMPKLAVISPGVAAAVNVGLNVVLIPRWEIAGAAISSLICYGLMLCFSVAYIFMIRKRWAP